MIVDADTPEENSKPSAPFRVTMMFHPSHHVTDLSETENWFANVFGRSSTTIATAMRQASASEGLPPPREGYPTDYSTFTLISDVLFDSIDPKRYVLQGVQRYPSVERPHLKAIGWYVEGMAEAYRALKHHRIRMTDQLDVIATGDEPPMAVGRPIPLYFTLPEDAGLRYEFFPSVPFPLDPRVAPGWSLPAVSDDDPLGIERCSHHTVLTGQLDRALKVVVDVLGGQVLFRRRNETLGADSTYVRLADSVMEFAIPDEGTPAHEDWTDGLPHDTYHAITWKVSDLARVEEHLRSQAVRIQLRSDDTIVTDPTTSLGIPWGFTTRAIADAPLDE